MNVVGLVLLAVCVVGLVLHEVPMTWQPAVVATSFARYLMWTVLPAALLVGLAHRWIGLGIAVVAFALVVVVQAPAFVAETPPADATGLTVLQANLKIGAADPSAIVSLVRDDGVQVLATEELTSAEEQRLEAAGLSTLLPYRYAVTVADGGVGIWSRYPLSARTQVPGYQLGVLRVSVAMPGGLTPTFVAVHLLPPYPYAPPEWLDEISRLRGVLDRLGSPVVVAGDFNATVDHAQFRHLLTAGYADAAEQAGAGYTRTYPSNQWYGPLIGIDHVLTRGAVATEVRTVDLPGSDHLGLLVQVAIPDH